MHMNISQSNPGVLVMDSHVSHIFQDTIDMASENGLSLLTFPPHYSHKLPPLDVCVFGLFKNTFVLWSNRG